MSGNNPGFPGVTLYLENEKEHRREIAAKLNTTIQGKLNAYIDVTLTHDAATTTIVDARIGFYSAIIPAMAMTAHAATAVAAGIWVNGLKTGQCVLNHANSANTDQSVRFIILG